MTLEQVFKLIDAGYTKQEIAAFEGLAAAEAPETAPDPEQKPETKPATEQKKDIEQADRYDQILQGITGQLKSLTEAVQLGNIRNATGAAAEPETTESIIKSMFDTK